MNSSAAEDLTRVTVISPTRRIDLALPGSATLAELLPGIVTFAGHEATTTAETVHNWVLQRFGDDPFDAHVDIATLNIRDGETLHLRHRESTIPEAAFDDVVDAVATSVGERPGWRAEDGRVLALVMAGLVAIGAPLLALLTGRPLVAAGLAGVLCFGAGLTAVLLSRALGLRLVPAALAWYCVALAGITAYGLLSMTTVPIAALGAAALVLLAAGTMALGARATPYALLGVALAALLVVLVAMVVVVRPDWLLRACAVGLALVLATTSLLPMTAYRVAGVAMPNLPSTAQALMADKQPVQSDIVARAIAADSFLAAFLIGSSLGAAVLAVPLAYAGGWAPLSLLVAAGLALLLRAPAFTGRGHRLSLLLSGSVVTLLGAVPLFTAADAGPIRTVAGVGAVLLALWLLVQYAASLWSKVLSPVWGRTGDIIEWLAIMAVVPLTLAVLDAYTFARNLRG